MSPTTSQEIREIVKTRGEEFERSQSPYSIALVPQINSKITKRPPRPQSRNLLQMEEKQIFCKKAAGEINKESAGSPEPFLAFHQEGKKQIETIGQFNDTRS